MTEQMKSTRGRKLKPFSSVALVGPDGSGKSTVAKALLESSPVPLKYIYMGVNIESSNIALPTSRLAHMWKVHQHKKNLRRLNKSVPEKVTLSGIEHRTVQRGGLARFARLLRRISEEVYRQIFSWIYQVRGHVVLYDRHFLFDACPSAEEVGSYSFTDSVHHWFLRYLYPRPGLVVFLDAPALLLYARKKEVPVEYLERERLKIAKRSCYARKFVTVDTTKPFEEVVSQVNHLISEYCNRG
jgi:thymidylate kinase